MTLVASSRSVPGTLRQEVLIDGRHRLVTDEPPVVGGEGLGPAPHELLPAALASCIATMLTLYARTKRWELESVAVDVSYENKAEPRRFDVDVILDGDLAPAQLARLESVARTCPVRRALESGAVVDDRIALRRSATAA